MKIFDPDTATKCVKRIHNTKMRVCSRFIIILFHLKNGAKEHIRHGRKCVVRFLHLLISGLAIHRKIPFSPGVLLTCLVLILYISFFPNQTFFTENEPFYGDFAWYTEHPVHFSAGDFRENGRGGIENYIPDLRLTEYTIKKGDTLWGISRKFDVDPDSIISCNVFSNVHSIHEGDVILVPNIRGIFVTIHAGDSIFKYSTEYKIPPDFVMEVNRLRSNALTPGMKLFLPGVRYNNIERAYALGEAFTKPVHGRLTSRYGYRRDPFTGRREFHRGIDLANRVGIRVHAAQSGTVLYIGRRHGYGKTIIIQHRFGYKTLYGHLDTYKVHRGQHVSSGQVIGTLGNTGRSTGPHLHFEIWLKSRTIDPLTQTNMAAR
jgi:murein DD-endopeptidase MepM/ murein hydrolase activator NlpD